MTITISLQAFAIVGLWLVIGSAFAVLMPAISPQAVIVLLLLWPVFLVLIILAPAINWYANREFRND